MSSNFLNPVFFLISSFLTLSFHVIPNSFRWNRDELLPFFICMTGSRHNSASYSIVLKCLALVCLQVLCGDAAVSTNDGPLRETVQVHLRRPVRHVTYSSRCRHWWRQRQLSSAQSQQPAYQTLVLSRTVPGLVSLRTQSVCGKSTSNVHRWQKLNYSNALNLPFLSVLLGFVSAALCLSPFLFLTIDWLL